MAQNYNRFTFSHNSGDWEDIGNSSTLHYVNWAAVIWAQTKRKYPRRRPAWRAVDVGCWLISQLESLGSPLHGLSMWLGLLTVGQLGSKRETLKGEHYKREEGEANSCLKTWTQKSQNFMSTTFYWSKQSQSQPTFRENGNKLHLLMWEEACVGGEGRTWWQPSLRREAKLYHVQVWITLKLCTIIPLE